MTTWVIHSGLQWLAGACAAAAALPGVMFAVNVWLFARPRRVPGELPAVSVLIPARNEELSIGAAVTSVLASKGVELEVVVLDDGSTDRTAEIVRGFGDGRVRLERAPSLPAGWNGKQHACWTLAGLSRHEVLCFLDADVRLGPYAVAATVSELERHQVELVSGFPRQETRTFLEWLLLPLIHFVLLGFLPMVGERWGRSAGFAAGCGQFMMVRKEAYMAAGGHAAIRTTMHDGLLLPQRMRAEGFRTRVYDLSRDAVCRMYRTAGEVWRGLSKNATEGMAAPGRILVFTLLLGLGQVLPVAVLATAVMKGNRSAEGMATLALGMGYLVRLAMAARYRQSWRGALLHPVGMLVTLVLQWWALVRKVAGKPATWKQREYTVG